VIITVITPVFTVTYILLNKDMSHILIHIFWGNGEKCSTEEHLFEIEIFCNLMDSKNLSDP